MWNKGKSIFLSYRRDDVPGYVRQLQEDLQEHFGKDSVFRDVEDIAGGQQWREVLTDSLERSAVLIVVIGPRWEQIWNQRADKSNDFVVLEIAKARELGLRIIPVTINGAALSASIDLSPISWLMEMQQYDISDKQGRWPTDVMGLVTILEQEKGLNRKKQKSSGFSKKWLAVPLILGFLFVLGLFSDIEPDQDYTSDPVFEPAAALPDPMLPVPAVSVPTSPDSALPVAPAAFPDIAGHWYDDNGSIYEISDVTDGVFFITEVFDIGGTFVRDDTGEVGIGQFMPELFGKFSLVVGDQGYGEYAVSTEGKKIMGWFYINETAETYYGAFTKADGAM